MKNFPEDFKSLSDSDGNPLGGFGGNPDKDRAYHIDRIRKSGKTPVVLVHGNTGTATHPQWGWQKVINELKRSESGYLDEHFWALSYLGTGDRQIKDPYTSNVDDLRLFTDYVRSYLEVDCVDMVGHSLGCYLILCYLGGLKQQSDPIEWDQGARYSNVGTIVLIDGAMKGLSQFSQPYYPHEMYDEWLLDHPIYQCLKPDNTPFGKSNPKTPPPPGPHNLTYWCCMVPGGYVDQMDNFQGMTGHLDGADQNKNYNVGSGVLSHEKVKDEPAIIRDWAVYLNSVPPTDPVIITVDHPSGNYESDLTVTVFIDSNDPDPVPVNYVVSRVIKKIIAGHLESEVVESRNGTLFSGQTLTIATEGMWEVLFEADGAARVFRTYWMESKSPQVDIVSDSSVPFSGTLKVLAVTDIGMIFMNNGGSDDYGWVGTSSVSISETTIVKAISITVDGIASEIVSEKFEAAVIVQKHGTVTEHYIAGRLDVNEYLHYGSKYGYLQRFTLYKINGVWVDTPDTQPHDDVIPVMTCSHDSGLYTEAITVVLTAIDSADPAPKIYYTTDESTPTTGSACFINRGCIELKTSGEKILKYFAQDRSGNTTDIETRLFEMEMRDVQPYISTDTSDIYHDKAVTVTINGGDDIDPDIKVYYTVDGTVPDIHSPSFINVKEFFLKGNGNHAISCYSRNSSGDENRETFCYVIQDSGLPETKIFPDGGSFINKIEVSLTSNEAVEWIKYTTDGSTPDESNGNVYQQAFVITDTTLVKFRSKDTQGNPEDVKLAKFNLQTGPGHMVFENIAEIDGYIKADQDGSFASVVDDVNLAVGAGWDGKISRSIVSFDTSAIPQGATIIRAYVQIKYRYGFGNPWENAQLKIDVKNGKFGSDSICQTDDWDEEPTALGVAIFAPFDSGNMDSSDFSDKGIAAINKNGRTQMRFYFDPHDDLGFSNYVFLEKGASVRLFVDY